MAPLTEISQLWPTLVWIAERVIGSGHYYVLWLLAMLYCLLRTGDRPDLRAAVWPLLILFALIVCPPIAWLLLTKVFSAPYYPRFVWVLMVEIMLAYVGTHVVRRQKGRWRKGAALLAVLIGIAASGQFLFAGRVQLAGQLQFSGKFYQSSNRFKLQNETIAIADYLRQNHAGEWGYFTEAVNIEIRQYDSAIRMVSGRGTGNILENALDQIRWKYLAGYYLKGKMRILVIKHNDEHERKLSQLGWMVENRIGLYDIYNQNDK